MCDSGDSVNKQLFPKFRFSLIELIIVIAIILILLSMIQPAYKSMRENAYRVDCLNRLRQLSMGWTLFPDDHGGKIMAAVSHDPEFPWVKDTAVYGSGEPLSIELQKERIREGALYEYTNNVDVYGCINKEDYAFRTFSGSHPMNGLRGWTESMGGSAEARMTRFNQIENPSERMNFIDDWNEDWDAAWAIYRTQSRWWNTLPQRHDQGVTLSYADGHAEFYHFVDSRSFALSDNWMAGNNVFQANNEDIRYLGEAVWGPGNLTW